MFRSVNEKIRELNDAMAAATDEYVIACECDDVKCVQTLSIREDEYVRMRENPRHFVVLPGHVYPDVENVVSETEAYVIVEKVALAAEVAEELAE